MAANPTPDPEFADFVPKPTAGPTFSPLRFLLILGIVAAVVALFLPAVRTVPRDRGRLRCANNLRQVAIALRGYEQAYGCLPPAHTVDAAGRPLHSWRTLILPYLDYRELYESIDLAKPWDDPANAQALQTYIGAYHCPGSPRAKHTTTYLAVVAPGSCFLPTQSRRLAEVTDQHDWTLMVVEAADGDAVPWMKPTDAGESLVMGLGWGAAHHQWGTNLCFVSGRVWFLDFDLGHSARRPMISIAGNDSIAF